MKQGMLVALALFGSLPAVGWAQEASEEPTVHPAEEVVLGLVRAIDYFDLEQFVGSFAETVTMFYPVPGMPERVDGRAALEARQKHVFESLRQQFEQAGQTEPPFFHLVVSDLHTQPLGPGAVVVTYHVDRGAQLGRRTAVVQHIDGRWQIVSFHSSNLEKSTQ